MTRGMNAAAVVAALNEEATVAGVVRALKASPRISEVIVVDDGSDDATGEEARAAGADMVIRHPRPFGKGESMLDGAEATDADIIGFWDADLLRLAPEHVECLLAPVLAGGADLSVGLIDRGALNLLNRRLPLVSGQRVVRRSLLARIPPERLSGYRADLAISLAAASGRAAPPMVLKGVGHVGKFAKRGFARGLRDYAAMARDVVSAFALGKKSLRYGHERS